MTNVTATILLSALSLVLFGLLLLIYWRYNRPAARVARAAFDRNPYPMAVKGPDGRYLAVNNSFVETFGHTADELIGRTAQEVWPSDVSDPAVVSDMQVRDLRTPVSYVVRMAVGPQPPRLWRVSKFVIPRGDGWDDIAIFYADITDEQDREQRLRDSETRLSMASEYAGIWDWDMETSTVYVSPAFKRLLGFSDPDGSAFDAATVNNLFHPDDFSAHRRRLERHLADPRFPYESIHRLRMANGSYRWFKAVGSQVPGIGGRGRRIAGTVIDVHDERVASDALKLSEARLTTLFNNAPLAIHFKDSALRMQLMNRSYAQTHGLDPDTAVGKTASEIFPDARGRAAEELDRTVIESRSTTVREETMGGRTFLVARFPVTDRDGNLIGLGGIETDITERAQVEEAYRVARDQAQAANRAKSQFLANMSHELRTPLNSIIGFSEVLLSGSLGPLDNTRHQDYVSTIRVAGVHLLEVINDILDLSRIEAGHAAPDETDVDIAEIVSSALLILKDAADRNTVRIGDRIAVGLPKVRADGRQLKQVIINLMSNAIKFTERGGSVEVIAHIRSDGDLEICVSDTGIGIASSEIERVQEPFAQVADAMTRGHAGTGLGLAIVRAIVNQHQGRFELRSELGKGTRATAILPAKRILHESPDEPQ